MYVAYQSAQFASRCPVRFSCSRWAASARRSALARSLGEAKPGAAEVIFAPNWTAPELPGPLTGQHGEALRRGPSLRAELHTRESTRVLTGAAWSREDQAFVSSPTQEPHMSLTTERPAATPMQNNTVAEPSCSAVIHAPVETVDIPDRCFSLPDSEYQACSPAHCAAGGTTTIDRRRASINVEIIGGSLIVQHYVEDIGEPDHLRLVSHSDLFTPTGRTKIDVVWDLSVRQIDEGTCEFTNSVHSSAPPGMLDFLGQQGIPLDVFRTSRRPISEAHNRQETPLFAKSIERHALANE
jgi:hypothetical protein